MNESTNMRSQPTQRPVSKLGPTERVRPGQLVKATCDPAFDEFVLAIHPVNNGQPKLAPAWTAYYQESPAKAKHELLSLGAQIATNSIGLILG